MQRLYLQYQPLPATLQQLLQLQTDLQTKVPTATPVAADQLHLTIIHFGILRVVFGELQAANPALTYEAFERQVEQFVQTSEPLLPATTELAVEGLAGFGTDGRVLVVALHPSSALSNAQASATQLLQVCLRQCGIPDPAMFMATNHNFRHALSFRPHVSLFKQADHVPRKSALPNKLQFQVMPTRYD